jgi:predicted ferric reductase
VLCCLLLLSLPFFRRLSYEVFLRLHQTLAVVCAYATWRHLEPEAVFPRLVISVLAITFASMLLVQSALLLYHNKAMGAGLSRAQIVRSGGAIRIRLHLSRHIKVEAGQYIGLWIPAIGFWSSLQSHPFTVVTWSEGKQKHLDLLVERRGGWTRKLSELRSAGDESLGSKEQVEAEEGEEDVIFEGVPSYLALFTGPHGISAPASDYETVVMVASGFGIASQLSYLKQLLYGYNAHKSRNRRIHLVWQIDEEGRHMWGFGFLDRAHSNQMRSLWLSVSSMQL